MAEARRRYEQFVAEGVSEGSRPELVGGGLRRSCGAWLERGGRRREGESLAYDERVLGSPEFVLDTLAEANWERRQTFARPRVGVEEVAKRVLELTGVEEATLRSASKRPAAVAARRALIEVAVRAVGHSGASVARYLRVVPSTVNRQEPTSGLSELAQRLLEVMSKGTS